jgi:hypothetical protein
MATAEVVELCERAAPGCTVPEIVAALRQAAAEDFAEADALVAAP